ncbi:transcriptional regulator [Empedobacter brevis]|uniref:transcriptional regulator n=1 Tax=Empedobacter brevis TaxID=247 RepID=UPI0028963384|nr:transcriptional regulator [Empedobacter brevis]
MNYSRLIKRFWSYNEKYPLGAVAVALYLFLLEIWDKNKENDFNLSDTEICERLKIIRPTIISLRQKLTSLGMIQYQPKNGLPGYYKIITEYSSIISAFEKPINVISKKKKNRKKSRAKIGTIQKPELTSENQVPIPTPISSNIPSLEEFTKYAKTLENYIPELENLIIEKYESWTKNDWKNGYNKSITNWKSSIKNAIPFLLSGLNSSNTISSKIVLQTIKRQKSNVDE